MISRNLPWWPRTSVRGTRFWVKPVPRPRANPNTGDACDRGCAARQ